MRVIRPKLSALLATLSIAVGSVAALGAQSPPRGGGDFQVGDRIVLRVDVEPQLNDTFTVSPGPSVLLPIIGNVSLAGVPHDQIEKILTDAVAKLYRNPVVHARALVRIAILGQVVHPGFYAVPAEMLVPDVLMVAGGPMPTAQVNAIVVNRGGAPLIGGDSTKKAIARGLTLSQLGIRSEDQFVVPLASDTESKIRLIAEVLAIPIAIVTVLILVRH